MERFTITEGARTTAGGMVLPGSYPASINGAKIALEGDVIVCPACRIRGKIVCVPPRIPQTYGGKAVALSDDLCLCGCFPPPRLIAKQSVHSQVLGQVEVASARDIPVTPSIVVADSGHLDVDELEQYFVAIRANGQPVDLGYSIRTKGRRIEKGHFNSVAQTSSFPIAQDIDIVFWARLS